MSAETKNDPMTVLKLVELFSRSALDGKGLGDRQCIEAIHDIVAPLVPDPIGYDQIILARHPKGERP